MEHSGNTRNILETTCIVQVRARLTPTLTHVVTYELVTSGAEDDAMSQRLHVWHRSLVAQTCMAKSAPQIAHREGGCMHGTEVWHH